LICLVPSVGQRAEERGRELAKRSSRLTSTDATHCSPPPPPKVRDFVRTTDAAYSLSCCFLDHPDFNRGLRGYLDSTGVAAIVLGTRR
jgi:hypothetical protein